VKIDIQAAPGAVALDTETAAVLVIDMQNDFGARGGMSALLRALGAGERA